MIRGRELALRVKTQAPPALSALQALIGLLAACSTGGCSSASTQCDCASPRLDVNVPDDRAPEVTSVGLSGAACAGVSPSCDRYGVAGGCVDYGFDAVASGNCHIDVAFQSGEVFSADVGVTQSTGCCAGFYADPVSAGQIDVPDAADAGGE